MGVARSGSLVAPGRDLLRVFTMTSPGTVLTIGIVVIVPCGTGGTCDERHKRSCVCCGSCGSSVTDARIDRGVEQVDDEVDDDERRGEQQDGAVDQRIVAVADGFEREPA